MVLENELYDFKYFNASRFYFFRYFWTQIVIGKNFFKNKSELKVSVKEEWLKIPYETLEKLIESMPRRIEACISNDGWPTRY